MDEALFPDDTRQLVPGFEVVFHVHRRNTTVTLYQVSYTAGLRRYIARRSIPLGYGYEQMGQEGATASLRALVTLLADELRDLGA